MRFFSWLLRAFVFFVLFAFALNNQNDVQLHWFFGYGWHAPMVIVVLAAFGLGSAVTLLSLLPGWWRLRRKADALDRAESALAGNRTSSTRGKPARLPDELAGDDAV